MGLRPPPRKNIDELLAAYAKAQLREFKSKYAPLNKDTLRPVRCRCGTLATIAAIEKGECAYCGEPLKATT